MLNIVYDVVARKLTEWENHRYQSDFENKLVLKIFLLQYINSCLHTMMMMTMMSSNNQINTHDMI